MNAGTFSREEIHVRPIEGIVQVRKPLSLYDNKVFFREAVQDIYGSSAIPEGKSFDAFEIGDTIHNGKNEIVWVGEIMEKNHGKLGEILRSVQKIFDNGRSAIIKTAGRNGEANLCLSRRFPPSDEEVLRQMASLLRRSKERNGIDVPPWLLLETWIPWQGHGTTVACSFFIGEKIIVPSIICGQNLTRDARFLGPHNILPLSLDDQCLLQEHCLPVVQKMQKDGEQGFVGLDVVLTEDDKKGDRLVLEDSKLKVTFVDPNPWLNPHDIEALNISKIVALRGRSLDEIAYSCTKVIRPSWIEGWEMPGFLRRKLSKKAFPLPEEEMVPGTAYFVADWDRLWLGPDNITFLGVKDDITITRIKDAEQYLRREGVLCI